MHSTDGTIRLLAITKQTIFLERISLFFKPENIVLVGIALSPVQGINLIPTISFDVLLMDVNWSIDKSPFLLKELVARVRTAKPLTKIIAISTFYSDPDRNELKSLGIDGYFFRTVPNAASELISCIKIVASGKQCFVTEVKL